jgi:hypothetical protein
LGGDSCGPDFIGKSCTVTGYSKSKLLVSFKVQGIQEMGSAWASGVMKQEVSRWFPTFQVSSILKMNAATLSRICASLKVSFAPEIESADFGLGLKFEKRNLCVPGFARRNAEARFELSENAIVTLNAYRKYAILFLSLLQSNFLSGSFRCYLSDSKKSKMRQFWTRQSFCVMNQLQRKRRSIPPIVCASFAV